LLSGAEYDVASPPVLELVRDTDCSAYVCEFVALAKQLGTSLVTMDKKLIKAFPKLAMPLPIH
jgi:predicted nucleic acid-binding protein